MKSKKNIIASFPLYFKHLFKWLLIITVAGLLIGSASAFFLTALNWVTNYRESNIWIISFLPLAGLGIGLAYHHWGKEAVKGNNLLLEEYHQPKSAIPFIMAPLVLFSTLITHLFGGSAGREGTAIQMGGAIADQFTHIFKLTSADRQILIIIGISAGFASVFGTPVAGAIFAVEVMALRRLRLSAVLPSLAAAFIADYTCRLWNVPHTHYIVNSIPELDSSTISWTLAAGVAFGVTAWLFSRVLELFAKGFSFISYAPARPLLGGIIIVLFVILSGTTKFIGLGLPTIIDAFNAPLPHYDFLIKLFLTTLTLGAGFKGGEVTPLFFIGAALGNALGFYIPLPLALLAGMGFVAVFAGATNTPLACTVMGMELFGFDGVAFIAVACCTAYLCSGPNGIYTCQADGTKHRLYKYIRHKRLKYL